MSGGDGTRTRALSRDPPEDGAARLSGSAPASPNGKFGSSATITEEGSRDAFGSTTGAFVRRPLPHHFQERVGLVELSSVSRRSSGGNRRVSSRALALALTALSCAACGSKHTVLVTPSGRIGPLRLDESTRADVIAFAGKPESERRGRYSENPPFDALGYGCRGKPAVSKDGVPGCETVFYLDSKTDRLAILDTFGPRYVEAHGVRVGTPTGAAERRLHMHVHVGCADNVLLSTRRAFLFLWFYGGKIRTRPELHIVGGRVGELIVHSVRLNPGVIDCVDS
jgi:hypothetical protein